MATTKKKKEFLKRLAREKRNRPPVIFKWKIISEKGKVLATIKAPYGDYAIHSFRLGIITGKYKPYKGAVSAVPKIPKKKKGEKI